MSKNDTALPPWGAPKSEQQKQEHRLPEFVATQASSSPPVPTQEQITAAFSGQPTAQKSPFAPKPKQKEVKEPELFKLTENDPAWIELVRFCQKHGDSIIQARYPQPRGECIDTIYRGVTVFAHETTQVRHITLGWIDWKDAIYE